MSLAAHLVGFTCLDAFKSPHPSHSTDYLTTITCIDYLIRQLAVCALTALHPALVLTRPMPAVCRLPPASHFLEIDVQ
jgi:hypothetical protein